MAHSAYIDSSYYSGTYLGTDIDVEDFDRLALRASELIDAQIGTVESFLLLPEATQEKIKLATCVMTEWLATESAQSGLTPTSEKIGSYSYTIDEIGIEAAKQTAQARVNAFLAPTGLLYRGIG